MRGLRSKKQPMYFISMSESQRTILVKFNYIKTLGIIILTFYSNNWSKRSAVVIYNYVVIYDNY